MNEPICDHCGEPIAEDELTTGINGKPVHYDCLGPHKRELWEMEQERRMDEAKDWGRR